MCSLYPEGILGKKKADSRGSSSDGHQAQRNNKKEATFYDLRIFFRWLLSVDKTERQSMSEQMETWGAPGLQTTTISGR